MKKTSYTDQITKLATIEQAKDRYKLGRYALMRCASDVGAIIRFGRNIRINIERMDAYVDSQISNNTKGV